jgi:hypothetical protein
LRPWLVPRWRSRTGDGRSQTIAWHRSGMPTGGWRVQLLRLLTRRRRRRGIRRR